MARWGGPFKSSMGLRQGSTPHSPTARGATPLAASQGRPGWGPGEPKLQCVRSGGFLFTPSQGVGRGRRFQRGLRCCPRRVSIVGRGRRRRVSAKERCQTPRRPPRPGGFGPLRASCQRRIDLRGNHREGPPRTVPRQVLSEEWVTLHVSCGQVKSGPSTARGLLRQGK